MSQENVEILRAAAERFLAGVRELDPQEETNDPAWDDFYDAEVEWDASDVPVDDLRGVYRGREAVVDWWRQWLTAWETVDFDYELVDAGDSVVLLLDQRMRGRSTGIEVRFGRYAQIFTFREGRVVHWKLYMNQTEALAAAGLSE